MTLSITVNLPVKDVARSSAFFAHLGFAINPPYANEEHMELLGISDEVNVMPVSESRFKSMTGKDIADAAHKAEAVMQLRVESRERRAGRQGAGGGRRAPPRDKRSGLPVW